MLIIEKTAKDISLIKDWFLSQHHVQQEFISEWVVSRLPFLERPTRKIHINDFLNLFRGMLKVQEADSPDYFRALQFLAVMQTTISKLVSNYPEDQDQFMDFYNIFKQAGRIEELKELGREKFGTDCLNKAMIQHMESMLQARSSWFELLKKISLLNIY